MANTNIKKWILETQTKDDIKHISQYGCVNGTCSELIYYSDTLAFYDKHDEEIWEIVSERAFSCGQSPLEFINQAQGNIDNDTQFKNLLVWISIEMVCDELVINEEVA